MLTEKQIEEINETSNKIFRLEKEISAMKTKDNNYQAGIETLLHGIWNTLDAIVTIEDTLPF